MAAIVLRSWFMPNKAKLLESMGMMTESATTRAFTVAARIAGGVSIRMTSKSGKTGLICRRRSSSRLTFFASRRSSASMSMVVREEMQLWTDLDEVAADVGSFVDYQTMRR